MTNTLTKIGDASAVRYKAVNRAAALSLILAVLSPVMALGWPLAAIPAAAILLGWRGLRQIARTPEEYIGERLAWIGISLAALFSLAAAGWLLAHSNDVPHGYTLVDYNDLLPNPNVPSELASHISQKATDVNEKMVYIRGYMMPVRQHSGLKWFLLCRTADQCRYVLPVARKTDLIYIKFSNDLTAEYTTQMIGIGGRFHADPDLPHDTPYSIEADVLHY